MTAMTPNETNKSWHQHSLLPPVQLYLSEPHVGQAMMAGAQVSGFPLQLATVAPEASIDAAELSSSAAAIIEVLVDSPDSFNRFNALCKATDVPLIAAAYNPPRALVRSLIRAGAHDVMPLPLDMADLEASLSVIKVRLELKPQGQDTAVGKLISIVKSTGGAGATAVLGQMAIETARSVASSGRKVCLIDLDVQFGDAAFQLGLQPSLSVADLVEAANRLDGELLKATAVAHSSGLQVISAPPTMLPLDAISSDQALQIVELATREFDIVYVDLPANWTNWSLSLLARSDMVLLVTEISVTGLNRARRQVELIRDQGLETLDVRVVANRFDKNVLKRIRAADIRQALGRDIAFTVADDPSVVRPALDRGVPLDEIKRKSSVGKDVAQLAKAVVAAIGLDL